MADSLPSSGPSGSERRSPTGKRPRAGPTLGPPAPGSEEEVSCSPSLPEEAEPGELEEPSEPPRPQPKSPFRGRRLVKTGEAAPAPLTGLHGTGICGKRRTVRHATAFSPNPRPQ